MIDKLLDKVVDSLQSAECRIVELWPYVVLYPDAVHAAGFVADAV